MSKKAGFAVLIVGIVIGFVWARGFSL